MRTKHPGTKRSSTYSEQTVSNDQRLSQARYHLSSNETQRIVDGKESHLSLGVCSPAHDGSGLSDLVRKRAGVVVARRQRVDTQRPEVDGF